MTMKMEPLSRKNSSVMEIPSLVNINEDVKTQKMDILMILNPSEAKVKIEDSDTEMVDSENEPHIRHEPSHYIQQPQPMSGQHPLVHCQSQLEIIEAQNRARLHAARSGRTQLPLAPIHRRPHTFNPINAHHTYAHQYSLPPIYPHHDEGYRSTSPVQHHRHNHERHDQIHHRRHSHSNSTPKKKKPRSNKAYTLEEVDFIRYHKEDLSKRWPEVLSCFRRFFIYRQRDSEQCLSSRYYRDNFLRMYDDSGKPMRDDNGKIRTISAKVRRRATPAGRLEALPYTLVQKHPERAIQYSWVAEHHKVEATRLVAEMGDQAREILNSQRAQQFRKEELERGIATEDNQESIDESIDESSAYEGSSTVSSPQLSPRSSP
ncbi:hypothetical protein NHQ30_010303 [Ciborinia camelliae]|nr:hypothetical protein NHQ30_010303 [Ciborinia camelliae]